MIISGTGHRPNKLGGYGDDVSQKLYSLACSCIPVNTKIVISGMALGWDMAVAHAALYHGIPLVAAVPFDGQQRMWPKKAQDEWQYLIDCSYDVVVVSNGGYGAWKMQVRNKWMVDQCDTVLALWDGSEGGTGNCIKYANQVRKPIINLWDKFNG